MKKIQQWFFAALGMMAASQCLAADIHFSSGTDFTEMNLRLKQANDPNPQALALQVTLSPEAQDRLARITRQEIHRPLRFFINGVLVSTPTVQSVLSGPGMEIGVRREIAPSLIPTLLEPSAP
ncbi:SecDF P1 head subdomain-containing protein [Pseudomonas sp. R1-7]|uniref:SecDF P1 head subdomain-containing protein n=1 Tax=Pseudomonas sp. R1-7 TaxID=2817398 RepID=UPI003DA91001